LGFADRRVLGKEARKRTIDTFDIGSPEILPNVLTCGHSVRVRGISSGRVNERSRQAAL
jgi:hypothetical protein